MKVGRNDPCPCGSGKKYKKCCIQERHKPYYLTSTVQYPDGGMEVFHSRVENHAVKSTWRELTKAEKVKSKRDIAALVGMSTYLVQPWK